MVTRARRSRGIWVALVASAVALGGCRMVTGTGDLVVDDGSSGETTSSSAASSGSGGAGGQGSSVATTGATGGGGSGSATATTAATTTSGAGGSGGGVADCDEYCAVIEAQCSGAELQYGSAMNCADYCPYLADGSNPAADTLACRAKFLPPHALDCAAAGPGGASQCGDPCLNFCIRALFICPGSYVDLDACTSFCATLPDTDLASYAAPSGLEDTLTCRLYYLTREVSAPGVFCASVGQNSNNCM
jgi:hypothetical protein